MPEFLLNVYSLQQGAQKCNLPLINSHSSTQASTNWKSSTVPSWLLIGLNIHERMSINQKQSHFWAPCCYSFTLIDQDLARYFKHNVHAVKNY